MEISYLPSTSLKMARCQVAGSRPIWAKEFPMGYVSTQVVRSGAPMSRPCGVFELPREGEFLRPFNSTEARFRECSEEPMVNPFSSLPLYGAGWIT